MRWYFFTVPVSFASCSPLTPFVIIESIVHPPEEGGFWKGVVIGQDAIDERRGKKHILGRFKKGFKFELYCCCNSVTWRVCCTRSFPFA